ncbi:MAG: dCTP deaminase [Thermoplasmatota archaeon]
MTTWSDGDILAATQSGRFAAEPWHPEDLTPNGLDLRIGHVLLPSTGAEVSSGSLVVPPLTRFVVGTEAVLAMPRDGVGSLWLRSSWARRGVLASFGKVDAGFRGNLTLGAFNAGHEPLTVTVGERFCQVVIESLASPPQEDYGQKGRYQNQRGVTLAK